MQAISLNRVIEVDVIVNATVEEAWEAWTTEEGIVSFFAPACNIDVRVGGLYEILFNPNAEPGLRGAEGMQILAVQPRKMLSFTWNSPPEFGEARHQWTHVVVRFSEVGERQTKVTLFHDGWGEGEMWDSAFNYFVEAWGEIVLLRLRYRFAHGPVDWSNPPKLEDMKQSFMSQLRSIKIEGPEDFASNIDLYLSGEKEY
ncbi:MAG TPA: SRPBCC domain-containing protein [Chloroflexia bacterium]|nr:SRPBCC domain-containing protein [Chloroflexia bacterium]